MGLFRFKWFTSYGWQLRRFKNRPVLLAVGIECIYVSYYGVEPGKPRVIYYIYHWWAKCHGFASQLRSLEIRRGRVVVSL